MENLLEMIIDAAIKLSGCDVGQLYIMDKEKHDLVLKIDKNMTLGEYMVNSADDTKKMTIPLYKEDNPNDSNILVSACLNIKKIHISDIYKNEIYNFDIVKRLDMALGYKTKSMLVIPMTNYKSEVIGILQLVNPRDHAARALLDFSDDIIDLMSSLASQAAVAMTNSELVDNLQELFYDFIKSTARVIDENSPQTYHHINRVVDITMLIAEKINEKTEGHFKNIFFTTNELEELKLSAWMHDIGKIIIQRYITDKETRLQTIFDRIELIKTRFELISKIKENEFLEGNLSFKNKQEAEKAKQDLTVQIEELEKDFSIICACNTNKTYLTDDDVAKIERISKQKYIINEEEREYLTADEVKNLSVKRGTLTAEERKTIENHALMTYKMSEQLPFPDKFAKVPEYASSHHEMLDGSGYPRGLTEKDLPLQSRIMVIADIFEALTAKDRSYKEAMKLSKAIEILKDLKDNNKIDQDIFNLFINEKIFMEYANKEISPQQIDI